MQTEEKQVFNKIALDKRFCWEHRTIRYFDTKLKIYLGIFFVFLEMCVCVLEKLFIFILLHFPLSIFM